MIAQAWAKREAERLKTSWGPRRIRQVLEAMHQDEMSGYIHDEVFVQPINLMLADDTAPKSFEALVNEKATKYDELLDYKCNRKPFVAEVYTTSQRVMKEAERRGHAVAPTMSLETGWDFLDRGVQLRALRQIREQKPYCVVLAFPCGPFSPLQRLNSKDDEKKMLRQENGKVLMRFALEVAKEQMSMVDIACWKIRSRLQLGRQMR